VSTIPTEIPAPLSDPASASDLDVARDSDVPISTQIFWQLAFQIDTGRLLPGTRLPPVRQLGAALRVNPNTIRAVYRRLAESGYVTSHHGGGTRVADRLPKRRGAEALAGIVAEMIRRAGAAGFSADEVASAAFAAATERKRPMAVARVLFAECTAADASYDAERIVEELGSAVECEWALLEDLPERLERFHYDIVATSTFHADETQQLVGGRAPVVAMLAAPGYLDTIAEVASLPTGSRVGVICCSDKAVDNLAETLRIFGATGVSIVGATVDSDESLMAVDAESDIILVSREAQIRGLEARFARPERIRPWTYELDPSGLELLRRTIEHVAAHPRGAQADRSA
jgi:DNA-binding transcriptional regulator YhcF (GntR family)